MSSPRCGYPENKPDKRYICGGYNELVPMLKKRQTMKKLIIICSTAMSLWTAKTNAQITLDTIITPLGIGYDFYTAQISATETKYVLLDTTANTFSLYNINFTPFLLNIPVPEPFAMATVGFQPIYISRSLFDCDTSNIEYAYEAPTNSTKTFRIMRTDGTILFQLDSANGPYCVGGCLGMSDIIVPIKNTSAGTKLFLQRPYTTSIHIYSLCGTLPTDIFDFSETQKSFIKVFPNPTAYTLTFQINPPDNLNEYELVLLDNNAKEIKRLKVNSPTANYTIDISNFCSGTYYYTLCTKTKASQTGKFIIAK